MKYCVTINNKSYEVEVEKGEAAIVSTTEMTGEAVENKNPANIQAAATTVAPNMVEVSEQVVEVSPVEGKEVVKAPMAGTIIDIKVNVGSAVQIGDTLLVLEAMKMENEVTAHVDGIVAEIKVSKGANVSADDVLVVLK
ncbi:biotin/lipoyl-containing protein [Candidatus Clostridium stratigraminis]|uniref:Biotin/lipoyl-containing protein n=1 Tax=Candidatus Clostridium stratigraminis TaxID=3381661 RepID=A0ABW8T147_9CLOT